MKSTPIVLALMLCACTPQKVEEKVVEKAAEIKTPREVGVSEPPDIAPPKARQYRAALTRNARIVWGLNAPLPLFGAQIEQESGWNEAAVSPVGAQGLAQFMPSTSEWIDDAYPDLGKAEPFNPDWALRALVRYDFHLYGRVSAARTECDRYGFTLAAYNGGEKWIFRARQLVATKGGDAGQYWGAVELVNAGRSERAWAENRSYPVSIIKMRQPKYAVWGPVVCKELAK